ncbi:hypothetical protein [Aquincola sp. J276]|uniref:hypothetical protein n=1 Tax=Aquincola sp. J276 TaxID=2898432 RepID=UPI002150E3A2|nr:hypothetical protein [Aquincola sp. J276]MCR5867657.1 hypothetical protein [Aquincola sp. J276]
MSGLPRACHARAGAALLGLAAAAALAQPAPPASAIPPLELPRFAQPVLGPRGPLSPEQEAGRQQLLARARQALQAGEPAAAQAPLDQAAAMRHSADTELLMVQQMMQRGAYRQALAFAAHAAGAHADVPQARALYAWLAALGGQPAFADAQLSLGLQRLPDDALLLGARQALAGLQPGALQPVVPPGDIGPVATGAVVPPGARAVASGLLLPGGSHALLMLPAEGTPPAARLWVRDGLGRTRAARLQQRPGPANGLALAVLEAPLEGAAPLAAAAQPGFAGSPAVVVGHLRLPQPAAQAGHATPPAWPALHMGFLGRPMGDAAQALGVGVPAELPGALVLDLGGRLLGLALPGGAAAPERLLPLPVLRSLLGEQAQALLPAAAAGPRRTPDELYELALPSVLQVLAMPLDAAASPN